MSQEYLDPMKEDFQKVIAGFKRDLSTIRTGRASPQILENLSVTVASYGASMPLNQLGGIAAPDARLLVVNPWDKATIHDIEKAIQASGLGLNPSNDGQIIRVPIPALTTDRRKGLVKQVGEKLEESRVRARGVRREYNEIFKGMETDKEVTEDEYKRLIEKVQTSTDTVITDLGTMAAAKEKEVQEG